MPNTPLSGLQESPSESLPYVNSSPELNSPHSCSVRGTITWYKHRYLRTHLDEASPQQKGGWNALAALPDDRHGEEIAYLTILDVELKEEAPYKSSLHRLGFLSSTHQLISGLGTLPVVSRTKPSFLHTSPLTVPFIFLNASISGRNK
jgi:hypothetical protein